MGKRKPLSSNLTLNVGKRIERGFNQSEKITSDGSQTAKKIILNKPVIPDEKNEVRQIFNEYENIVDISVGNGFHEIGKRKMAKLYSSKQSRV